MAVQAGNKDSFTFVAGLNTEAGFFTFPENTWKEGTNIIPSVSGVLRKRTKLDLESNSSLTTLSMPLATVSNSAFTCHEWNAVGGNGDFNYVVSQVGRYVYFYINSSVEMSASLKTFYVDLNDYKSTTTPSVIGSNPIKAVSANGALIITSQDTDPILVEYDGDTDTITKTHVTIQMRDFDGLDDGLAVEAKPASLTDPHKYNLYNQGWPSDKVTAYHTSKSVYPSNAQSWVYGKDSSDDFDASVLDKQDFGTSPSPKGRYVLNAFYRDRATASGIGGIAVESEHYRPSTCAFFAGRAWYAGVRSDKLTTHVFFSQVAINPTYYGKCYQDADPTSEVLSDLIDSDGGVVPIQDCGEIIDLVVVNNSVLVLASNGVWQIVGTAQAGFTATGYEVKKVSSFGCVSRASVVNVDERVLFWSSNAICATEMTQVGDVSVKSLTDMNIRTLYTSISPVARQWSSGAYNDSSKLVYWLYNESLTSSSDPYPYKKTNILALDIRTTAFYTFEWTASTAYPFLVDVVVSKETVEENTNYDVVVGTDEVMSSTDTVVSQGITAFASEKQFKFMTVVPEGGGSYEVSWADMLGTQDAPYKFYDWYSFNNTGVSYDSYVLTGYFFGPGGPSKKAQTTYITTYMHKTETGFTEEYDPVNESGCLMQSRWDFTNTTTGNKWDAGQQIYRHTRMFIPSVTTDFDDGNAIVICKNKVRGRGRALQLKFTGETGKDLQLAGWSVVVYGGTNV